MAKMAELYEEKHSVVCEHHWRQAVECASCREAIDSDCPLELCVECGEIVGNELDE